ncbi:MAG: heme exporter protein CcmB [Gammaproteobacteria bacterium]|nr:heme exporter protein CcmB [Gammaproteobacteria bacterium]
MPADKTYIQQRTTTTLSSALWALLKRDLTIAYRHFGELMHPVIFFLIAVSLFPLAINPDPMFLQKIASGIIWVAALLSTMLALDNLFRSDYEDGTLEQLMLTSHPITVLILAKVATHWLVTGLPLIITAPLLGLMLNLPDSAYLALFISLSLGTPTMSLIGGIGVALTVGIRRSGILLTLVVMPLFIPVLIFGTSAVEAASVQLPFSGQLYLLCAMLIFSLSLAPLAIATSLRISLN